ncbi:MAG: hypothetical protein IPM35_32145 [Myxococcales bacterium]|nr:hypothetical protein [Myxococcales bacterium]
MSRPPLCLIASPDPPARPRAADATDEPIAEVRGVNIHAAQVVDGRDRRRVERISKYITRPPVAQERLERRPDGKPSASPAIASAITTTPMPIPSFRTSGRDWRSPASGLKLDFAAAERHRRGSRHAGRPRTGWPLDGRSRPGQDSSAPRTGACGGG